MMSSPKRPPEPILLSVLTGFLGSGKTSLLNLVLHNAAFSNTLVIINEFGDVGLDHLLVKSSTDQMIEMSSGCLCCTIRGDLIETLETLLRDRDNNRIKKFDRVIIETTGLADPAPIIQTLIQHPYFLKRFRLNHLITTIDAQHGMTTLDRHIEARKQAALADVLVMTKTDLDTVSDDEVAKLDRRIKALNPSALRPVRGEAAILEVFSTKQSYQPDMDNPDIETWLSLDPHGHDHHGHDHHGHDHPHHGHDHPHHDINRHSDTISSFSFTFDGAIPSRQYDMFLELIRANFGEKLLRFKGIVKIKEHEDKPVISHGVQHIFYPPHILEKWPDADTTTRIVCITDGVEKSKIEGLFHAFAGSQGAVGGAQVYEGDKALSLRKGDGLFKGEDT